MDNSDSAKKALIISLSEYDGLEKLEFCKNDGETIYKTLKDLGYEIPDKRLIVGKASGSELRTAIIDFFRDDNVKTSDTLLFYFSGHGVLDGYEGRYFASSDTNPNIPEENGVGFNLLTQQMDRSLSLKTISLLDCCFSGAAVPGLTGKGGQIEVEAEKLGREALSKQFKDSKGKCILASSLSQRRSYNLPDKKMSAFTYFIVEGLKGKKDSVDKDGYVTPEKLDEYVYTQLANLQTPTIQTPVRNMSISGRISLAHYPDLSLSNEIKELSAKDKAKNQENAHLGIWTDVKNRFNSAIIEIEKNPEIDEFSKEAMRTIPVVGVIFEKLYDKGNLPPEQKTQQTLKIFKFVKQLDEEKLEEFCRTLQKHRGEIIEDSEYLFKLSNDPQSLFIPQPLKDAQKTPSQPKGESLSDTVSNIKDSPQSAPEIYEIGVSLFMDKKYEEAARTFDEVTALEPEFIDAVRFKGRSLGALNRHKAAVFYFNKVLESSHDDIVVLFLKANSLASLEDPQEAIACYDQILKLQPENEVALKKRNEIQKNKSRSRFGVRRRFRKSL
ncbi:MAG TPA: caspase family protein [Candidatus Glassbacteria bacterium]|nr:caspase family protein [Candidatus Glassbacteria bacterium]